MSLHGCPRFCVCDKCSSVVASGHRAGDEALGRDWRGGHGCGCAACLLTRKNLDDIDAGLAQITALEDELARVRQVNREFRDEGKGV